MFYVQFSKIMDWTLSVDPSVADKLGNRLMMVYVESNMNPLGLQGGDLFTITYKLIGTVSQLLLYYANSRKYALKYIDPFDFC